jgi:MoxR-like ATPase
VSATDKFTEYLNQFSADRVAMLDQLRRVVVGQSEVIEQVLAAIFTRGHCLLVGVPGLAKTLLVSSIAQILNVSFKRVQFTPDLMPSDITGTTVLEESTDGKREFRFIRGPIFANIVLADEINRTPPSRSSSSPRRTRSSRKELTRCPRRSSTASCSTSRSITPASKRNSRS